MTSAPREEVRHARPAGPRDRHRLAVLGLGALAAAALVAAASAGPSSRVMTPPGGFTSGTVAVSQDVPSGTSYFSVAGLAPGDGGATCLRVTSGGSLAVDGLRLHAAVRTSDGGGDGARLADEVRLRLEGGVASAGGGCAGFVADGVLFSGSLAELAARGSFADGVRLAPGGAEWRPAPGEQRRFRLTWSLDAERATDGSQGDTVDTTFTWESRRG